MLKQLHFKSWLLMLCMLVGVGGNLWADDVLYYTLEPASTGGNSSPHNSYTAAATTTIDGIEWSVTGNSNMVPWRIGGKSITDENREVYSQTAMGSAITKVELTVGAASSITINSLKLIVASDASFSTETQIDEVSKTFTANSTITFTPTSGTEWAEDAYYKFVFNVSVSSTSNKFVEFTRAKFYKAPAEGTTAAPSISGTTEFFSSTTVTLTNAASAEGADIYYTLNGDNPTTTTSATCFKYSSPFELTATTTVKAIAKHADDTNVSSVVSKTFTKCTLCSNIAALTAQTPTEPQTYFVTLTDAIVTYVNGNYAYIQDSTGAIVLYSSEHGLTAGKVLNGTAKVVYQVRNGNPQITSISGATITSGNAPEPTEVVADNWDTAISEVLSQYFKITGATITLNSNDNKYYVQLGEESIQLYGQGDARNFSLTDLSVKYTIVGFPTMYVTTNTTTPELQIFVVPEAEEEGRQEAGLAYETTSYSINLGEAFTAPTLINPNSLTVTYTSSNTDLATIDATGAVTLVTGATGTTTITASFAGNDSYLPGDASYTLTVVNENMIEWDFTVNIWGLPEGSANKATASASFTDGTNTIVLEAADGYYFNTDGYLMLGKEGSTLTFPAFAKDVERIEVVGNSNASASTKQNIFVGSTAVSVETTGAKTTNIYEVEADYQSAGTIYILKVTNSFNTQITKIRIYLKDTVTPIKEDAGLVYETTEFNVNLGDDFTVPVLVNPNNLTDITFESSNEGVATVNENTGAVTIVGAGTVTITALFEGNDAYRAGSASYTLTVVDPDANDGSAEKPYTVAQALAASPANGVYVRGIVSQIDEVSTEFGNATYWISDDGETTTQIMIYRGKFFGNTSFTSDGQIKKGDKVVITGNLIVSNDAKQMAQGNYIVSLAHLRGDVNGDGKVTIADVTALVNIILGKE